MRYEIFSPLFLFPRTEKTAWNYCSEPITLDRYFNYPLNTFVAKNERKLGNIFEIHFIYLGNKKCPEFPKNALYFIIYSFYVQIKRFSLTICYSFNAHLVR
jgi:hypothetical protein